MKHFRWKHGYEAFIETVVVRNGFVVQAQMVGEEWINCCSLGISVIVALVKQMDVLCFVFGIVQCIDTSDIGILDTRCVSCPIRTI